MSKPRDLKNLIVGLDIGTSKIVAIAINGDVKGGEGRFSLGNR